MVTDFQAPSLAGQSGPANPVLRLEEWLLRTLAFPDLNAGYYPLAFTNFLELDWPFQGDAE